ncbi:MAG: hypothetical protein AABZ84_10225 [Pseudomonadota bacterium]
MKSLTVIILCGGLWSGGFSVAAEEAAQHSHHGMNAPAPLPAPNQAMDASAVKRSEPPSAAHGPWSYLSRDNPAPHAESRWEMLPVDEAPARYEAAGALSAEASCQRLLGNPRIMVDRATRTRCGEPARPTELPAGHQGHSGM